MITVHHLQNSRSQRVLWLLEELALPYDVKRYERDPQTMQAPPALRAVHPLGKSPVITDTAPDGAAVTVAESGAIVEYLVERAGGALKPPPGTAEARAWTYWLHFAEGSAMPYLVMTLVFGRLRTAKMPFFVKPIARGIADQVERSFLKPNIAAQLDLVEATLARTAWFAGEDFSAADVHMSFPVEAAARRAGLGGHPKLAAWLERVQARPAYRRALERGGPYELLG